MNVRFFSIIFFLIAGFEFFVAPQWTIVGIAQAGETDLENKIKAAFLVNFSRFITWPETEFQDGEEPLTFCIAGNTGLSHAFSGVESRKIKDRSVVIREIPNFDSTARLRGCHLLYSEKSTQTGLTTFLRTHPGQVVVTVGDYPGFARNTGIIELVRQNERFSFIINNSRAKEQRLRIEASLLNLAMEVY